MRCKLHPKYRTKKKPRVACEACWSMWFQYVWRTEAGCKACSFQPANNSDYCNIHRPPQNLITGKN